MAMKTLQCRDHGGTFTVEAKRGRPPVRCSDDNVCSAWKPNSRVAMGDTAIKQVSRPELVNSAIKNRRTADEALERPTKAVAPPATSDPSVTMAHQAKELLSPLGWLCVGKGWRDEDSTFASLIAARGTELITMIWQDSVLTDEKYSIWNTEVPSENGKPAHKTPFDVDEMSDRELVQRLSGMTVEWWNRIGQSVEKATVPSKLQITHAYSGTGDEMPGDRVVTFVDMAGTGFRTFRVGALMKVGSK